MSRDGAEPSRTRYPRPRKRFGQHFLEPAWVAKLVEAALPRPGDTYVEIGPGRGALTRALAPRVARLICVEIDRALAASLQAWAPPHVEIVEADFLTVDVRALVAGNRQDRAGGDATGPPPPVRVIGNLPYNVATPILFKLLDAAAEGRTIEDATLMLQKEVADRVMASPGTKAYGTLAVQVARVADVERLLTLPPGAFRPPPKVTSAVIRLRFRPPDVDVGDPAVFARLVRAAFAQRRKTVLNAVAPAARAMHQAPSVLLDAAAVDPGRRPEELTLSDFARLSRRLSEITS